MKVQEESLLYSIVVLRAAAEKRKQKSIICLLFYAAASGPGDVGMICAREAGNIDTSCPLFEYSMVFDCQNCE